jgi:hypothetical protein
MIISIDAEKAFDKIQHLSIIKALKKLEKQRMYLNIVKNMFDKSIANTVRNEKKNLKPFLLKLEKKQEYLFSPFFFYFYF